MSVHGVVCVTFDVFVFWLYGAGVKLGDACLGRTYFPYGGFIDLYLFLYSSPFITIYSRVSVNTHTRTHSCLLCVHGFTIPNKGRVLVEICFGTMTGFSRSASGWSTDRRKSSKFEKLGFKLSFFLLLYYSFSLLMPPPLPRLLFLFRLCLFSLVTGHGTKRGRFISGGLLPAPLRKCTHLSFRL